MAFYHSEKIGGGTGNVAVITIRVYTYNNRCKITYTDNFGSLVSGEYFGVKNDVGNSYAQITVAAMIGTKFLIENEYSSAVPWYTLDGTQFIKYGQTWDICSSLGNQKAVFFYTPSESISVYIGRDGNNSNGRGIRLDEDGANIPLFGT